MSAIQKDRVDRQSIEDAPSETAMADEQKYFLCTSRLGFRLWRQADFDLAYGLWGDPGVAKLIDARGRLSEEQVRERLAHEIETAGTHKVQYWPIFLLSTGSHIGCCGLRPYELLHRIYEIGFHIRPEYWRCGFAGEAARAVMEYAFQTIGAAGLFAGHHPENKASRSLLAKLGFRYTHVEYYEPTGLDHPSYLMTADDYARLRN
jgi:[ribosomal protein S5]-alanine N-acetyltransferase